MVQSSSFWILSDFSTSERPVWLSAQQLFSEAIYSSGQRHSLRATSHFSGLDNELYR
jgi:uncharacterized protein YhjY with autotransporter beta-barrel domain